jgi:hypothetical protein
MRRKKNLTENLLWQIWEADMLENGPAKCALLEELVQKADLHQDLEAGFAARTKLVEAATFSGYADRALVAFSWCLSQIDKDPDRYEDQDILWKYKWITDSLVCFPQISKKQIQDMLADMAIRYERAGVGQRAIIHLRWSLALEMGDKATVRKYFGPWKKAPRDEMSDCSACEQNAKVKCANFFEDDEGALEAAEPILRGRLRCAEVPQVTYGRLLLPLLRLQRVDEAARMHQTGYRLIAKNAKLLSTASEHLVFLTLTDNFAQGAKIFQKHLASALEIPNLIDRFLFFLGSQFLMERLAEAKTPSLKLRLPKTFPLFQDKGRYEVAEMHGWLAQEAKALATRFDQRNENDYFMRRWKNLKKLHALVTPYPVK